MGATSGVRQSIVAAGSRGDNVSVSAWVIRDWINDGSLPVVPAKRPHTASALKHRPRSDALRRVLVDKADLDALADKCEAAKNELAGKYAFCRQKAEAKAIKTGAAADYSTCDSKFVLKWRNRIAVSVMPLSELVDAARQACFALDCSSPAGGRCAFSK